MFYKAYDIVSLDQNESNIKNKKRETIRKLDFGFIYH